MNPETRYTNAGSVTIAYQILGSGPVDIVLVPGWVSNIDIFWEEPRVARFLRRIASYSRLILFDKRGTGMSDRVTDTPTLEERIEDVQAVMDAVGSKRATLIGYSEGGPMCALFAATHPKMVRGLVMIGSYPRRTRSEDFPFGPDEAEAQVFIDGISANWGRPYGIEARAPSLADEPAFRAWWARFLRMSASPAAAVAMTRANAEIDVRHVLPSVRAPTLLIHARHDRVMPIEFSRYMAGMIPGAKLLEYDGVDHLPWADGAETILSAIEEFATGARHEPADDRMLCTIMFTDIVGSTQRLVERGDRDWMSLIESHNSAVRRELASFTGREMNNTGDGFVAIFDGPARAIQCARAIRESTRGLGMDLRFGLHTGECRIRDGYLSGVAVHIASRVSAHAPSGHIVVSRTVKDLVAGSGLVFESIGSHRFKGVPEKWQLYQVA